jgi:ferredoxin-thioredoxin reductase catalytic subunit
MAEMLADHPEMLEYIVDSKNREGIIKEVQEMFNWKLSMTEEFVDNFLQTENSYMNDFFPVKTLHERESALRQKLCPICGSDLIREDDLMFPNRVCEKNPSHFRKWMGDE